MSAVRVSKGCPKMVHGAIGPPSHAPTRLLRLAVLAVVVVVGGCSSEGDSTEGEADLAAEGSTVSSFGPVLPPNPHLGPAGRAAMHGDSGSSDTTALEGPGTGPVTVTAVDLGAVCSVVAIGADGYPVALCTRIADVRPVVHLLDPQSGSSLASMDVVPGSLLGGVYGYLDTEDRMVLVDGDSNLLRIAHRLDGSEWTLEVDEQIPLAGEYPPGESVTSVSPDYDGGVWFATDGATVGMVDADGSVTGLFLGPGERVSNSISTAPVGMTVATTHAVYLLGRDGDGQAEVRWRFPYDRGTARKPGQLSWGTGSSPTFFGPTNGSDYVTFVDNADTEANLHVVHADGPNAGKEVCSATVLAEGGSGSENSPIGVGRTVVVAGTYGYPYPRMPADAGPSRPESAEFVGGMTRVDVLPDESGCDVVWESDLRSAAVPKLYTRDGTITTMLRRPGATAGAEQGAPATDEFFYAVIDAGTGELLTEQNLGEGAGDPLQLAGTQGPDQVLYQGTLGAVLRITPAS